MTAILGLKNSTYTPRNTVPIKTPFNAPLKHLKLRIDCCTICCTIGLFCCSIDLHSAAQFPIFGRTLSEALTNGSWSLRFCAVSHIFAFLSSHYTFSSWAWILRCQSLRLGESWILPFATPLFGNKIFNCTRKYNITDYPFM